ncbi:MAG: aminotransferase class V-fold PLP-dependent enzyme [Ignavibacteriales bacterium]|nr:aminotransferase class V-fold PLP-dependent enzyme [Ignavibacteriales bacterium]
MLNRRGSLFEATATALNILAQGITWQPGDRILIDHVELPSDIMPLLNLRHYGVEIDFLLTKTVSSTNNIIAAITPKTKLVHLNAVHYLNGYRTNLKTIGEYTSQNGIIFSVDATRQLEHFK